MTAAELLGVQVLYMGSAIYLAAVFISCGHEIRRDAQRASNGRGHPNSTRNRTSAESASETM